MNGTEIQAPERQALPTEIWATYIPSRNGPEYKLHLKRGFALSALRGKDSTAYSHTRRKSVIVRRWYDLGYRLFVLRPGQEWEDVSEQYIERGMEYVPEAQLDAENDEAYA